MNSLLRLGHDLALRPTLHNGPGWRVGLWVQGCRLRCTDRCLNPHLLPEQGGHAYAPDDVARAALAAGAGRDVEGLTVLGGEPTEQAAALAPVLAAVRAAGWTTMVYTGHTHEELLARADPAVAALLALTDVLVDGPYRAEEYDETLAWRGSRNQRLRCLTDRYDAAALAAAFAAQRKAYSLRVDAAGNLSASGLQERTGAHALEKILKQR